MKNILKCLSVIAIAGTIGMQTTYAEQVKSCPAGQVEHTNYYMFLETDTADGLRSFINENAVTGDSADMYTSAWKTNNIHGADYIDAGQITIGSGSGNTVWSIAEFWRRYKLGYDALNSSTQIGDVGTEHYLYHDKWLVYDNPNFTGGGDEKNYSSATRHSALLNHIAQNSNNLERSELVTSGTMIPATDIKRPATIFDTSSDRDEWYVTRRYPKGSQVPAGVTLGTEKVVYGPGAYFITYCVAGGVGGPTEKTITYDQNTPEPVAGMPDDQTFSDECTTISSKKPSRPGYVFLGWSTDASATLADSKYNSGNQYCGDSIVLHAIWSPNQSGPFTVTYNANGGKDAPASQSGQAGSCVAISSQKPTMQGNNFLGWSTDKNAKEPDSRFAAGQNYCGEQGNIELFAVWQTQTGVSAHFIAFATIAIISGAALIVAQKRDLFKQI